MTPGTKLSKAISNANRILEHRLSKCGRGVDPVRRTNLLSIAQSEAARDAAKGVRAAYPRKHFAKLDQIMGPGVTAAEYCCFIDAFEAYFARAQSQ